jgi:hypothetical protein
MTNHNTYCQRKCQIFIDSLNLKIQIHKSVNAVHIKHGAQSDAQ